MGYALVIDDDHKGRSERYFTDKAEAVAEWERVRKLRKTYSVTLWNTTHAGVKLADFDRGL